MFFLSVIFLLKDVVGFGDTLAFSSKIDDVSRNEEETEKKTFIKNHINFGSINKTMDNMRHETQNAHCPAQMDIMLSNKMNAL